MRSLMFLALGLSFAAAQSVRVEGRVVTDTGEAVAKAEVRLAAGPITLTSVGTNHDGKFVFADVPPGRYTVSAEKGGFIVQNNGALLDLTPGMDLKNIMIKMTPQGVVSGKVTDQDGDPMAGAQVYAMRYYYRWGRRELAPYRFSAVTNDLGDFRLGNIAPGRYYIGVTEKHAATAGDLGRAATEINLDTFYPGALDARSASQLDVTEGAAIQGIDIRLRRAKVYTVKGKAVYAA
ncbi:MAG: carboxypeptidase regulatory-like domain-containing protein, partial [Bryobacteraceae bacterium]